jgi:hypothetical protein
MQVPVPGEATSGPVVHPRDVLGLPGLPPAWVTGLVLRLRTRMARVLRAGDPAPVRIFEGLQGVLDTAALVTLCGLGVPERLTERIGVEVLAGDLGVDPVRLRRLVRYAAARGWVALDRRDRVRPKPVIRFLHADHAGGWRSWVEFMGGEEVLAAISRLDAGMREHGDPFATAVGAPFFAWMQQHPERHAVFDAAMAAGGRLHGLTLANSLDWPASETVCDVGGGTGALLETLLGAHPHLHGVLFELPQVIERARPSDRMTLVGGDAFTEVPAGCGTYLLVNVLHDWSDRDATRLLATVATAMGSVDAERSRVIIVEGHTDPQARDEFTARTDLLMFALTAGGRERTGTEIAQLGSAVGLRLERSVRLPSSMVAHTLHLDTYPRGKRHEVGSEQTRRRGKLTVPDGCGRATVLRATDRAAVDEGRVAAAGVMHGSLSRFQVGGLRSIRSVAMRSLWSWNQTGWQPSMSVRSRSRDAGGGPH